MSIERFLSLAALVGLTGCWVPQNQAATGEYARQVMVAQQRSQAVEESILATEARLQQLEEAMRAQGQSTASRLENIDQVNAEVGRLRGEVEVLRFQLDELKTAFEQYTQDMERRQLHDELRLRQLEKLLGVQAPPPPSLEAGAAPDCAVTPEAAGCGTPPSILPPEEAAVPGDALGVLNLAVKRLQDGQPVVARRLLEQGLKDHKSAAEVPEMRYRIGETYMAEGNWNSAVGSFQTVVDGHPKSDWAAWSMLRQAECFGELGQRDNAKVFYEEVVRLYPRSEAAKDAKRALAQR